MRSCRSNISYIKFTCAKHGNLKDSQTEKGSGETDIKEEEVCHSGLVLRVSIERRCHCVHEIYAVIVEGEVIAPLLEDGFRVVRAEAIELCSRDSYEQKEDLCVFQEFVFRIEYRGSHCVRLFASSSYDRDRRIESRRAESG